VPALAFLSGLLAVFVALRARGPLAARLGRPWLMRFLAVQAGLINAVLLAIVLQIANQLGWQGPVALWAVPLGYGVLFFFYSLSNIDWTAKKFHSEGV
jgi:hypothetical protein